MTKKRKSKKRRLSLYRYTSYLLLLFFIINIAYGVYKKPSHVFSPLSYLLKKTPLETWQSYQDTFNEFGTDSISASFLAALAQTESDGNPFATSYWTWNWRRDIFKILHPSSSASGIFQITAPTFKEAQLFCWNDKKVVYEKVAKQKCWMNLFRFRFSAYDSIYLSSARLNYWVDFFTTKYKLAKQQRAKEKLAAAIHLCGRKKVERYIKSGRGVNKIHKCGSHYLKSYLSKIRQIQTKFSSLASK